MYAWLAVNGFIHTEKFEQIFSWLIQAAAAQGCLLEKMTNAQLLPRLVMGGQETPIQEICGKTPQFVLFWDKDVRLARLLEKKGLRLFNRAHAIEVCDDKAATFLELEGSGVRIPRTIIAPKIFRAEGYTELDFLDETERRLGYPMVQKECYGSFGQQVRLAHNRTELEKCLHMTANRPCIFQEYIAASGGQDIRIQMVGQKAVAAMRRYNASDFRANVTNGGSMEAYEPTEAQLAVAREVMRRLDLDFAGIDLLFGEDGGPVLCEVNSNAHFVNICHCTGVNAANDIIRHCIEQSGKLS